MRCSSWLYAHTTALPVLSDAVGTPSERLMLAGEDRTVGNTESGAKPRLSLALLIRSAPRPHTQLGEPFSMWGRHVVTPTQDPVLTHPLTPSPSATTPGNGDF